MHNLDRPERILLRKSPHLIPVKGVHEEEKCYVNLPLLAFLFYGPSTYVAGKAKFSVGRQSERTLINSIEYGQLYAEHTNVIMIFTVTFYDLSEARDKSVS